MKAPESPIYCPKLADLALDKAKCDESHMEVYTYDDVQISIIIWG